MNKLIRITTIPQSLNGLLKGQLKFMSNYYEVVAISSEGDSLNTFSKTENVRVIPVTMTRTINPFKDIVALYKLYKIFLKEKPFIVHTHTPKAGTLGMLAAFFARVPNRLHTVAGLPLLVMRGTKRKLLNIVEKLTYACATNIYPNSFGLMEIIAKNNYTSFNKLKVIGNGSSNGIDTSFFDPNVVSEDKKNSLKMELGINAEDFIFIYIGRIVKDKGINELVEAFHSLNENYINLKLILLGNFENHLNPIKKETVIEIERNKNIIYSGYQTDVRPYLAISDILTFPSYREGFPNVVLQASAMSLPSIVTDINGCNEIIIDNFNGLIVPPQNVTVLFDKMEFIYHNKNVRRKLSENARNSVIKNYNRQYIWNNILKEYQKLELKGKFIKNV